MMKKAWTIENKKVSVYSLTNGKENENCPAIYLNMYSDVGDEIASALEKLKLPPFTLVAISDLSWDCDMCPWECPPTSKNDTACVGGADEYLEVLTKKIMPLVENAVGIPSWRGIAGYSLGGLFAVYSIYKTHLFSRVASVSGSLWFPDFAEFCTSKAMAKKPECVYFSLGDKECATKNKFLKCVQEKTQTVFENFKQNGIKTEFHLNSGGHFVDALERTVAGIKWILTE